MKTLGIVGAGECQHQIGREPAAERTGEVDEHEHGEGSERGEERRLRVPDQLVGDCEHGRHHDRRAGSGLERPAVGIGQVHL
jgi:hypothetical protein